MVSFAPANRDVPGSNHSTGKYFGRYIDGKAILISE